MKCDHRSKFSNLSNWKEEAWKKSGLQQKTFGNLKVYGVHKISEGYAMNSVNRINKDGVATILLVSTPTLRRARAFRRTKSG